MAKTVSQFKRGLTLTWLAGVSLITLVGSTGVLAANSGGAPSSDYASKIKVKPIDDSVTPVAIIPESTAEDKSLPTDAMAQDELNKGLNAAHEGEWQDALAHFLAAAGAGPSNAQTYYHVGVACYHLGKLEHARTAETIAIGLEPRLLAAYMELSTIECKLGNYGEACNVIEQAEKQFPDQLILPRTLQAVKQLERGAPAVAFSSGHPGAVSVSPLSKAALLYSSKDVEGLYKDSEAALKQGDLLRAKTALQFAITLHPLNPEPYWRLCNVLEAEGRTTQAVVEARKAAQLEPHNPHWQMALGWAYSRAGKWDSCFDAFKEAYVRDNNLHDAIVGQCYALAKQKQFILARITLHISDPAAHDTSWYHAANGLILQEKGQLSDAYQELQRALQISPNDYQIKYVFARVSYQLACKNHTPQSWKSAARDAQDLLAVTPYDVEVLVNLGVCQTNCGEHEQAVKTLSRAVKFSPSNAGAQAAYASVLAQQGKKDEAKSHAQIAKKIDPSQKLAESLLQKLK